MFKKLFMWLTNFFSQFYFTQILLSGGISWGTIHLAITNHILSMNSFYWWCIGIVLFFSIWWILKKYFLTLETTITGIQKLIIPYSGINIHL